MKKPTRKREPRITVKQALARMAEIEKQTADWRYIRVDDLINAQFTEKPAFENDYFKVYCQLAAFNKFMLLCIQLYWESKTDKYESFTDFYALPSNTLEVMFGFTIGYHDEVGWFFDEYYPDLNNPKWLGINSCFYI